MAEHSVTDAKRQLEKMLADLTEANQSAEQSAATVDLDQTRVGRLSRMDALQTQALAQSTLDNRRQRIRDVKAALRRIENDDYGYCADCDEEIDRRRLEHNPAVACCIACTEKQEKAKV